MVVLVRIVSAIDHTLMDVGILGDGAILCADPPEMAIRLAYLSCVIRVKILSPIPSKYKALSMCVLQHPHQGQVGYASIRVILSTHITMAAGEPYLLDRLAGDIGLVPY